MRPQKFRIDFFDKTYFDQAYDPADDPVFQMCVLYVTGTDRLCSDDEAEESAYQVYASRQDFPGLALSVLEYVRQETLQGNVLELDLSASAAARLDGTEKKVLDEILQMHNRAASVLNNFEVGASLLKENPYSPK